MIKAVKPVYILVGKDLNVEVENDKQSHLVANLSLNDRSGKKTTTRSKKKVQRKCSLGMGIQ